MGSLEDGYYISSISVDEKYRRQGATTALLSKVIEGEGSFVFDKICSSILNATKHQYDDQIVGKAIKLGFSEIFVTKIKGEMPFTYISNVITPFR